jgi:hypothetical protein
VTYWSTDFKTCVNRDWLFPVRRSNLNRLPIISNKGESQTVLAISLIPRNIYLESER